MPVVELSSSQASETENIGRMLGEHLVAGDVLLLSGPMGAGKTVLVRGIAAALGIYEPITSPTFVLIRSYVGSGLALHHGDLWRLETQQEVAALGLEELVDSGGVAVLEWGEKCAEFVGPGALSISFELDLRHPEARQLTLACNDANWNNRLPEIMKRAT